MKSNYGVRIDELKEPLIGHLHGLNSRGWEYNFETNKGVISLKRSKMLDDMFSVVNAHFHQSMEHLAVGIYTITYLNSLRSTKSNQVLKHMFTLKYESFSFIGGAFKKTGELGLNSQDFRNQYRQKLA